MGTNRVFLPKAKETYKAELAAALAARPTALTAARFQELAAGPEDCCTPTHVPVEDVYEEYNLCSSCLQSCKLFHEEQCGFDVIKEQCLPNVLLEGCAECEGSGCGAVVAFLDENAELNASAPEGADNITRLEIFTELVWEHAREQAVKSLPTLKDCIDKASTVGLAEKCLAAFLHPMPATLAHEALSVAQEVGPPQCKTNYVGSKCLPTPDPEMHGGSCPQGFMCMPDPSRCSSCACSCNSPEDKLDTFEACMQRGKSAEAGSFCMAALFTQLPPAFVEQALHKASEPAGASEHYTQIFSACGGGRTAHKSCRHAWSRSSTAFALFRATRAPSPTTFQSTSRCATAFGSPKSWQSAGPTRRFKRRVHRRSVSIMSCTSITSTASTTPRLRVNSLASGRCLASSVKSRKRRRSCDRSFAAESVQNVQAVRRKRKRIAPWGGWGGGWGMGRSVH